MPKKRASYKFGIERIALNDDPTLMDEKELAASSATLIMADLFGCPSDKIAQ